MRPAITGVRPLSGVNLARGDWQCSRVYAVLGRGEPALWHARRCLELTEAADDAEDWDLPFAYEALARAHAAAGHGEEAARFRGLAEQAGATIADPGGPRAPARGARRPLVARLAALLLAAAAVGAPAPPASADGAVRAAAFGALPPVERAVGAGIGSGRCRAGAVRRSPRARERRAAAALREPRLPAARAGPARLRGRRRQRHRGRRPAGWRAGRGRQEAGRCRARASGPAWTNVPLARPVGEPRAARRDRHAPGAARRSSATSSRRTTGTWRGSTSNGQPPARVPFARLRPPLPAAPAAGALRPRAALLPLAGASSARSTAPDTYLLPATARLARPATVTDARTAAGAAAPRRLVPGLVGDLHARPAHRPGGRLERRRPLPGGVDRQARRARRRAPPLAARRSAAGA